MTILSSNVCSMTMHFFVTFTKGHLLELGQLLKNDTQEGALMRHRALIGRKALNRIIAVFYVI